MNLFCGIIVMIIIFIISLMDCTESCKCLFNTIILLHIDYMMMRVNARAHWKYKHPHLHLFIHSWHDKPGNDPLILSRMNAEMLNGYDDALN